MTLFELFEVMVASIVMGFLSSAPPGPINLWVAEMVLMRQRQRLYPFLFGVILADCIYAAIAAWGYGAILEQSSISRWLSLAGGVLLVVMGGASLIGYRKVKAQASAGEKQRNADEEFVSQPFKDVSLGLAMVGLNPAFLMFWLVAINMVGERLGLHFGWGISILFLCGVVIGDLLWFAAIAMIAKRSVKFFGPRLTLWLRVIIAGALMVIGSVVILKPLYHN